MAIHPTAIVEDGAALGADVEIGPFCIVSAHSRLDDGVRLLAHVTVMGETRIGARCTVYPGAVLGGDAQIHSHDPAGTKLEIGTDTVIREGVTLHRGSSKSHGVTRIGSHNYLMAYSHVGHDSVVGDHVTFANGVQIAGHVVVGDNVVMGGLSAVQQFGRIGRGAMLGGISGANENIIPFGIAHGSHARLAGLNIVGLKRRQVPRENIHALRHMYKTVFLDDSGRFDDRVALAKERFGAVPEVAEVIAFIESPAKRPICRAQLRGDQADT